MTIRADNEKICVDPPDGNKKAAGLHFLPITTFRSFTLRSSGTLDYYQFLFAVSLHELCETISTCK